MMPICERNLHYLAAFLGSHAALALAFGDRAFVRCMIDAYAAGGGPDDDDLIRLSQIRAACAGNEQARAA